MPQSNKVNDKIPTTATEKAKNIQLAVNMYKDPTSDFLLRAVVSLYHYSKNLISNHFNDTPKHEYASNVYVE
jgi:hypothetical protein